MTYRNRVSFGNATPTDLEIQDWIILRSNSATTNFEGGAIEFSVTNARGVQTAHLFELGQ